MRFISLSRLVASSSDMPPDRNTTPGISTGTCAVSTRIVSSAMSPSLRWSGLPFPGTIMLTFSSEPGRSTRCCASWTNRASSVREVASAQAPIPCAPSIRISGSTIGTMSAS